MNKRLIIMHDGAVEELMALVLAASMPDTTIEYVGVLNGDCIAYPTVQLSYKMLHLCGVTLDNIYLSDARAQNAFPWSYRKDCLSANLLPLVNQYQSQPPAVVPHTIADLLSYMLNTAAQGPFTILCLCPLSDVARIINALPSAPQLIEQIVWTGGNISLTPNQLPPVNIDTGVCPGANPYAEWNVYWDAAAVATVFASGIPLVMFPTLVTDQVPLTQAMLFNSFIPFAQTYRMINVASQLYAIAAAESGYHLWNTCTTAYLSRPDLFQVQSLNVTVDVSLDPAQQGTMFVVNEGGYKINVATWVNNNDFFQYYISQLAGYN